MWVECERRGTKVSSTREAHSMKIQDRERSRISLTEQNMKGGHAVTRGKLVRVDPQSRGYQPSVSP